MAGMTIRELVTKWGFSVDDEPLKKMDAQVASLQGTIKLALGVATGAAASIFGLAKSTAMAGDAAAKAAERLGINVESLQEFGHVANLAGVDAESFNGVMGKFIRNLQEAKSGSGDAAEALAKVSKITGRDLVNSNLSAEEKLLAVSDAFAGMTDSQQKAQLATQLFGREGLRMVNVLNQGSASINAQRQEARDLGLVLSEETAKASEEFEDSQTRLFGALTGIRNIVGAQLIPVLTELIQEWTSFIVVNREWLSQGLTSAISVLVDYLKSFSRLVVTLGKSLNGIVKAFGGWAKVSKLLLQALVAILALQLAGFLGNLVINIFNVVKAFNAMRLAAISANIAAAAIPIAIGAAIILLGLIIEDVIAFFQGKDSITGLLLQGLEKNFPRVFEFLKTLKDMFVDTFTQVKNLNLSEVFDGMVMAAKESATAIYEAIIDPFVRAFNFIKNGLSNIPFLGKLGNLLSSGPSATTAPATAAPTPGAGNVATTNSTINAPVTVNVPPGTPPGQVAGAVRQGTKDAMDSMLRQTNRATRPAVAY